MEGRYMLTLEDADQDCVRSAMLRATEDLA